MADNTNTELAGPSKYYHPCTSEGSNGHQNRHWGPDGAAGLLAWTIRGNRPWVLLSLRSRQVQQGGCWSIPGGAIDAGESPLFGAVREFHEEVHGGRLSEVTGTLEAPCPHGCGWTYTTFVVRMPLDQGTLPRVGVKRGPDSWETEAVMWWPADDLPAPLHPAFAASWPALSQLIRQEMTSEAS